MSGPDGEHLELVFISPNMFPWALVITNHPLRTGFLHLGCTVWDVVDKMRAPAPRALMPQKEQAEDKQ